jgi:hypothetical protein
MDCRKETEVDCLRSIPENREGPLILSDEDLEEAWREWLCIREVREYSKET